MAKAKKKKVPKKPGPERIPIDPKLLRELSEIGCSVEEIASMLRRSGVKVTGRTIQRRLQEPEFKEARDDGVNALRVRLRSRQVAQAMMMNGPGVHMSIYLSKQYLGMSEKVEHSGKIDSHIEVDNIDDRLNRKLDALRERIYGGDGGGNDAAATEALAGEAGAGGEGKARVQLAVLGPTKPVRSTG